MYLKNIEVQGFKSFANKINFQFHNGITGIVGPNGSGKSNVADAVRWVLGEQRIKQLRGASMQDVIFAGTENRKPLGYAYVAITLDNSDHQLAIDYEEVTVARRVYRSGESEYLINGTNCRLKDVNELFYDTGIGKEGYSIIGQGQIDKILSGKPEERRELFDEAAGIVKFKRRKATAIKKLEEEQTNLLRVNDILSELEKQVIPLEKQSETAREYLKKKEELKTLDINMFLLEAQRIKEQLVAVDDKYHIASGDLKDTSEKYESIKIEYEKIESELERLDFKITQKKDQVSNTNVLRGKLDGEINVLKEQINSAKVNDGHMRGRMNAVNADVTIKRADKEHILGEKTTIDRQVAALIKVRDEARGLLESVQSKIEALNSGVENGKNQIIEILNERAGIKSKTGRYDTMLEQIQIRKAELNSKLLRSRSEEAEQEKIIEVYQKELYKVEAAIREMEDNSIVIEEKLADIKTNLENKDRQLRDSQIEYHKEKSGLESLKNLTERYDGYGNSIRRVMEKKDSEKGILGVVADIVKVEKKYEIAVETALGGSIQNIVTADEDTAKRMIAHLKQNKYGRATFLPLTSVKSRAGFIKTEVLREKGVIGIADTLVHVDGKYKELASHLLGGILVVDHIDNAIAIAKRFNHSLRIVTAEGESLTPGGAMTGGAFKNSSNLLGRRREIEELEKRVRECLSNIDNTLDEIEQVKADRADLRKEYDKIKAGLQETYIVQNTAKMNASQAEERKIGVSLSYKELETEDREISGQVKDIKQNKEIILKELSESEETEKRLEIQIGEFIKQLEQERIAETRQLHVLSGLDLEVANLIQKQEFQQENVERISKELERFQNELKEIIASLDETAKEIEKKKEDISKIEKTIAASENTQGSDEGVLRDMTVRKEELSNRQKNFFKTREELSERMNALDKEVFRLSSQKEKLEELSEDQINYMWDEYEITFGTALNMRDEELTELSSIKKKILILKEEIKQLGDVNVNAIEDYKNLIERYTFLKEQRDDLVEAEKILEDIIEELDSAMRKQFLEKFEEIAQQFDKVFKELFGGGKGTLGLMEDSDILEAGVRIIAQPPGKKLQNMMQLSGGEKSLTAIALLFAIQNLKPSPFCLLDEIEAALDESNVGRFAKYLHKLTKHTQFIVITHRRGTMEKADRLYGITMQEKGVSALVSVNLIDSELDD